MDNIIKDSIKNSRKFLNTPDVVYFCDEFYIYNKQFYNGLIPAKNYVCYPFTYEHVITNKVYFGNVFEMHYDIEPKILKDIFKKYTVLSLDKKFPQFDIINKIQNVYKDNEVYGLEWSGELLNSDLFYNEIEKHYSDEINSDLFHSIFPENEITYRGRVYDIEYDGQNILILTLWNLVKQPNFNFNEVVDKVFQSINKSKFDIILVARGNEPYYVYKTDSENTITIDNNSEQHNIHLANQKEKREFFDEYLKNKEKKIGSKLSLYDKDGKYKGEMPLAQYNALGRVDETKKHRKIYLKESQLKEIIKNNILKL